MPVQRGSLDFNYDFLTAAENFIVEIERAGRNEIALVAEYVLLPLIPFHSSLSLIVTLDVSLIFRGSSVGFTYNTELEKCSNSRLLPRLKHLGSREKQVRGSFRRAMAICRYRSSRLVLFFY